MWDKLTYSRKTSVILIGFILIMIFGYKLSFYMTFELRSEIKQKEEKLTWLKDREKELPFIRSKMALIEEAYTNDSISIRDKLTAYISDFAENSGSVVTEIPEYSEYRNANLNIQTNVFTIKGQFNELVRLIYELESKFKVTAKIMSARFFSIKDMQTKRKNLYLTLVTQSFNEIELKTKTNEK